MLGRRRAMMTSPNKEKWDYEITDPTKKYGAIRLDVKAGDTFYLEWDIEATTGYVYDMRGCGGKYLSFVYNPDKSGQSTIKANSDGYIVFGGIFTYTETGYVNMADRFNGKYIRIRVGG